MRDLSVIRFKILLLLPILILLAANSALADETENAAGPKAPDTVVRQGNASVPYTGFNDPVLNDLINRALTDNPGIDAAIARIDVAEAAAQASLTPLHPKVFAEAGYLLKDFDATSSFSPGSLLSFLDVNQLEANGVPGINYNMLRGMQNTPAPDYPNYMQSASVALTTTYDVDITGRYREARSAALKEVAASREEVQAQGVAIATLVVQNYYDVVAAKRRVALIEVQIENYEKLLKLVMAQFDVGSASSLDVLQQKAQLESKKAQLPLAKTIIRSGRLQLAALLDMPESDIPEIPSELPKLNAPPAVPGENQLTGQLLENQPTLRAARIRIDALRLKETSARKTLYPSLGLIGKLGYGWSRINEWDGDEAWQIGATLTVPIYMGGANRAGIAQAKAATRSAEYALQSSLVQSKTQVLIALEVEQTQRAYLDALREQTESLKLTVQEATRKYMAGLSSYLNVLNANDVLQLNQLNMIQAERNLLSARISLLEALGGDWTRKLVAK